MADGPSGNGVTSPVAAKKERDPERMPPIASTGSDRAVICCAMSDPRWFNEVKDELDASDFFLYACQYIWKLMHELVANGKTPSLPVVRGILEEREEVWEKIIGGRAGFLEIVESTMQLAEGPAHLQIVRERAALRRTEDVLKSALVSLRANDRTPAEILEGVRARLADHAELQPGARTEPVIVTMKDVTVTPDTFLWPGRIPLRRLSMTFGDPGDGKSYLTCSIAAGLASGKGWPGTGEQQKPFAPADTLIISAEDLQEDYKARLERLSADMDRIHFLDYIITPAGKKRPWNLREIDILYRAMEMFPRVKLVLIDPILAFMVGHDSNDARVRELLTPLGMFAAQCNVAVKYIMHANKDEDKSSVHRAGGNMALIAQPRISFALGPDPADERRKVWACVKVNGFAKPSSLAFRINDEGFFWDGGVCNLSADDILRAGKAATPNNMVGTAMDYIRGVLATTPMPLTKIVADGEQIGINRPAIYEARDRLIKLGDVQQYRGEYAKKLILRLTRTPGAPDAEMNGHAPAF